MKKPPRDSMWRSIHHGAETLRDLGILADGTLRNPNGYPENIVREAVIAADARRHARRSEVAKKAAVTRQQRVEAQIYAIVQHLLAGGELKPRTNCRLCGKGLTDQVSIKRGIGTECWQGVIAAIEATP